MSGWPDGRTDGKQRIVEENFFSLFVGHSSGGCNRMMMIVIILSTFSLLICAKLGTKVGRRQLTKQLCREGNRERERERLGQLCAHKVFWAALCSSGQSVATIQLDCTQAAR